MKNRMNANSAKPEDYERSNRETAQIILADPVRHGGEEALAVRWARLVMSRAEVPRVRRHQKGQQRLFPADAAIAG